MSQACVFHLLHLKSFEIYVRDADSGAATSDRACARYDYLLIRSIFSLSSSTSASLTTSLSCALASTTP
jgi:hypothetical protein